MSAEMSPADRLEVMDLIANYARSIDRGDVDGWLDNFVPDAVMESTSGVYRGTEELRGFASGLVENGTVATDPQRLVHFVGLPLIAGDAERCQVETYCLIFEYDVSNAIRVPLVARYDDICVHTEAGWRIERRLINADLSDPNRQPAPARAR